MPAQKNRTKLKTIYNKSQESTFLPFQSNLAPARLSEWEQDSRTESMPSSPTGGSLSIDCSSALMGEWINAGSPVCYGEHSASFGLHWLYCWNCTEASSLHSNFELDNDIAAWDRQRSPSHLGLPFGSDCILLLMGITSLLAPIFDSRGQWIQISITLPVLFHGKQMIVRYWL